MKRDLSAIHSPVTGLFIDGSGAADMLSDADLQFCEANGYIAGAKLLSDGQVRSLCRDLARLMEPAFAEDPRFYEYHSNESIDPSKKVFHALGAWRVSPVFHDLIFYKPLVSAAEKLLNGPVRFWHDQLFVKPAHDGGVVAWHQDYSYWTRTKPVAHLTCWIGLDDSTIRNGCVHYVPGSHRWNLLSRGKLIDDMDAVLELLTEEQRAAFRPAAIELAAGEASFHHPMTVHGSYENTSDRPRRSTVINFIRDGVLSASDEPLLDGIPPVPKGEPLSGRFFPLLSK